MVQLLTWEIDLYPHLESWPPEIYYSPFGFGIPFCIRGRMRFGFDDISGVVALTFTLGD